MGAAFRHGQALLEKQATELRLKQAQQDLSAAIAQRSIIQQDVSALAETTKILVRRAQGYIDIVTKYIFWAARALDLFTAAESSTKVSYDYGYIHPDLEAAAYRRLRRGDGSLAAQLGQAYVKSWSRLPDILLYREAYESYLLGGRWCTTCASTP